MNQLVSLRLCRFRQESFPHNIHNLIDWLINGSKVIFIECTHGGCQFTGSDHNVSYPNWFLPFSQQDCCFCLGTQVSSREKIRKSEIGFVRLAPWVQVSSSCFRSGADTAVKSCVFLATACPTCRMTRTPCWTAVTLLGLDCNSRNLVVSVCRC